MRRVLLLGESNPLSRDPRLDLYPIPRGSAGGRLAAMLCGTRTEYLRRFDRLNLCRGPWDREEARVRAKAVLEGREAAVALGRRVAEAVGVPYEPFRVFSGHGPSGSDVLVLPHPSGRCRAWNDPSARGRARAALEALEALARRASVTPPPRTP